MGNSGGIYITKNEPIEPLGILSSPLGKANIQPFFNLVKIIRSLSSQVTIIFSYDSKIDDSIIEQIDSLKIKHHSGKNSASKVFNLIKTQLRLSWTLIQSSKKARLWIFFIADTLILPVITGKILRKKIFLTVGGSLNLEVDLANRPYGFLLKILKQINFFLADGIIIYSGILIKPWHLEKYERKIFIAHRHFIDFKKFSILRKYQDRPAIIGYIGRLSIEKGVLNFVHSIPQIAEIHPEYQFQIIGNGPLSQEISQYIFDHGLQQKIQVIEWVDHDKVPEILNNLKLFILPSFSEGLPNIMIESMACGTPVVATPVGAIPDLIQDNETGFIIGGNSPECIAMTVNRALNSPTLEKIALNGRHFVEETFTFEKTVNLWRSISDDF